MTEQGDHHRHPIGEPLEQEADALIHPEAQVEIPPAEQMSLLGRLRQPRTILSIAVPIAVIAIAVGLNWDMMRQVPGAIGGANPLFILIAFAIYYIGFPLRGFRWTRLLRGAGYRVKTGDATEILFLSWFVNCIVPAKLGDLYRAYLVRQNSPVSATRTLGTVFMERILDLVAIAALGVAAGYFRFRGSLNDLPGSVQAIFAFGVVLVVALIVAANIVWTGVKIVRRSVAGLMARAISAEDVAAIQKKLDAFRRDGVQFHALITRQAGAQKFVSVHVLVPDDWTVRRGHGLLERIEADIRRAVPAALVFTHLEPLNDPASWEDVKLERPPPRT